MSDVTDRHLSHISHFPLLRTLVKSQVRGKLFTSYLELNG